MLAERPTFIRLPRIQGTDRSQQIRPTVRSPYHFHTIKVQSIIIKNLFQFNFFKIKESSRDAFLKHFQIFSIFNKFPYWNSNKKMAKLTNVFVLKPAKALISQFSSISLCTLCLWNPIQLLKVNKTQNSINHGKMFTKLCTKTMEQFFTLVQAISTPDLLPMWRTWNQKSIYHHHFSCPKTYDTACYLRTKLRMRWNPIRDWVSVHLILFY